mmetsp:Transcript_7178/g.12986  ORF Transcript_7178/g.12986 Transcript_7178/m.12986 type:complete len:230 (-) Transcript_7178:1869-2558(-)
MHFRAQRRQRLLGQRATCLASDYGGADAPIDDEGRAQRWPEHLRLADQRHHLGRSPQVVGAGLNRDQHALGRQQRGARQGGDARRAVDDDMIGPPGEFWCFLMQRFACEAHGAEQPWQTLLAAALCPVQRGALWIGIQQDDRLPAHRQLAGDVGGERGLAHAAFLVQQRDDHGLALRVGKPGCCSWISGSVVVVHRGAALLLSVRCFKLGKLREAETRASIGFAADGHA